MMVECLVYIGAVFVLLGAGYAAMYRCIENSVSLRRNAEDIVNALHIGERWRADIRAANGQARIESLPGEQVLHLPSGRGEVAYRFSTNTIFRRVGAGQWSRLLQNVKSSEMKSDARRKITAWRWELELQPRARPNAGRLRPLFTFVAVPKGGSIE
jgi:hypothetical protein